MIIIVDSREKENKHIIKQLQRRNIEIDRRKLQFGDYSFYHDGKSYENKISIERKGSLTELAGNFTKGRERFRNEFERSREKKCKIVLMVENGSIEQIKNWDYRSQFNPSAYIASLKTWCYKYQLTLTFVRAEQSAEYMLQVFENYLKGEEDDGKSAERERIHEDCE